MKKLPTIYNALKRVPSLNNGDTTYLKYMPSGQVLKIKINKIDKSNNNYVIITHKDNDSQITNKYDRFNGCMEDMKDIVLYPLTKQEYRVYLKTKKS